MHLLIVDDDIISLELLQGHLLRQGYEVSAACSGMQAMEVIRTRPPDVLLLDVMMPDMDGHEICRRLKSEPALRSIPILMMSARDMREDIVHGLDAGADDYLTKPFDLRIVAARVRSAVRAKQDADRIRRMNETLNQARLLAEAASNAKSCFLANMSHELRTPLTAIRGFVDLLQDALVDQEQRELLSIVARNADYLLELINEILDLAKIEAGRMELTYSPCSVREIVSDVAVLMHVRAQQKDLVLTSELDDSLPPVVESDALRLRQVLVNLVGNAIKFTDRGNVSIRALARQANDLPEVVLEVSDTGVGIAPHDRERIFEPFAQADASVARRFAGTGLGLAVARRIIEKMGGRISVESELGEGSTFRVVLPCRTPSGAPAAPASNPSCPPEATADRAPVQANAPLPSLHCRVLLAEDGPDNQRLISTMLSKAGAEVALAANGHEVIGKALTEAFDMILMDMHMPYVDGYTATRRLREAGYDRPIIALTASAMEGDRAKCLEAGCDDYVSKPIDRRLLLETVARYSQSPITAG
jgi:signal transduction histidine kinase